MLDKCASLALTALLGTMFGVGLTLALDGTPDCYEDQVIVWTGTAHNKCVDLDDLTEK